MRPPVACRRPGAVEYPGPSTPLPSCASLAEDGGDSLGNSGWRGIVGQDITFRNVRLVLDATAEVLRRAAAQGEVLVSYDTRLLSEKLAHEAVAVLTHHGFATVTSERDLPSPCLAHATRARDGALGVMFTASHNPPEYNGVKLFTRAGTAASRELTDAIEAVAAERARLLSRLLRPAAAARGQRPLTEGYLASLERDIDWEAITIQPPRGCRRPALRHGAGVPRPVADRRCTPGGLCEAVNMTPRAPLRARVAWARHGEGRSRSEGHGREAVVREHRDRLPGELLGEQAGVVRDEHFPLRLPLPQDLGGGVEDQAHVAEGDVLADDAAPAGSSEANRPHPLRG